MNQDAIDVGRIVSLIPNNEGIFGVLKSLSSLASGLVPHTHLSVTWADSEWDTATIYTYCPNSNASSDEIVIPVPNSLIEKVLKTSKSQHINIESAQKYSESPYMMELGVRSFLALPLMIGGELWATLNFGHSEPNAFDSGLIGLANRVSSEIASLIIQVRMHQELHWATKEKEVLVEIGRIITSSFDIEEVHESFANQVRRLIPADRIVITTIDKETKILSGVYIDGDPIAGRRMEDEFPVEGTQAAFTANTRESHVITAEKEEDLSSEFPGLIPVFNAGYRSFMSIPLISEDNVIGALQLRSKILNAYTPTHVELAERIASQISGAIANSELHKQLERQAHEMEVLANIGRIISSSYEVEDVYERFTQELKSVIAFDRIGICPIDWENFTFTRDYVWGTPISGFERGSVGVLEGSVGLESAQSKTPRLIQANTQSGEEQPFQHIETLKQANLRSFLVAPMQSNDDVIGNIFLSSEEENAYSEKEVAFAASVANQIAGAISNSRLYNERKDAEQALRTAEEKYRDIFENALWGIFQTTPSGQFISANTALARMFGYDCPEQLVSEVKDLRNQLHVDPTRRDELVRQINEHGAVFAFEWQAVRKDCTKAWISVSARAIKDDNGDTLYYEGIVENITQRKNAEDALRLAEEATRILANENATMAEIGLIIGSNLDIDEVYEHFADEVSKLIPADRISVSTVSRDGNFLIVQHHSGESVEGRESGSIYPIDATLREVVKARESKVYHPDDFDGMPDPIIARKLGLRSRITTPLISNDEVIGILIIHSKHPNAYAKGDIQIAERISSQIAGAIASARLYTELDRTRKALEQSHSLLEQRVQERTAELRAANDSLEREIQERAFVEEQVSQRNAELNAIFQSFPDLYFWVDTEGIIIDFNARDQDDLYASPSEFIGKPIKDVLPPDVAVQFGEAIHQVFEERNIVAVEYSLDMPNGRQTYEARMSPLEGNKRMIAIVRNITESKRLEEQVMQSQKLDAIGQLAGGVAHDFNNILSAILSYSQLGRMKIGNTDLQLKDYFVQVERAAERAANLTRQLLTFSRREMIEPRILNINDLIVDIERMLRRLIGENIELVTIFDSKLNTIKADPGQMEQILVNLVVNARDAMPYGGKVTVQTQNVYIDESYVRNNSEATIGNYVCLTVSDTGEGMTEEVRERIFEPFFTTKDVDKGTGLGLSTCYGIVAQNGGHITVQSEINEGSTFNIYIPVTEGTSNSLPLRDESGYLPTGGETILLVEDESLVRTVGVHVLKKQGYKVLEAANGTEALRIAEKHKDGEIALLLTDMVMPLMGGRELADEVRELHPSIKVLYTSGYSDELVFQQGALEEGAEFMQKPFTPQVLTSTVRNILDKPPSS